MEIREALEKAVEQHVESDTGTSTEVTATSEESSGATGTSSQGEVSSSTSTESSGNSAVSDVGTNTESGKQGAEGELVKPSGQSTDTEASGKEKTEGDTETGGKPVGENKEKQGEPQQGEEDQGSARFRVDRAPQSWKGEARNQWNELPLAARQEIIRRERAVDAAMRESAGAREFSVGFQRMVQPYMERLNQAGNPIHGIKLLLEADRALSKGSQQEKAQMVGKLIADYGVNVETLDQVLSQAPNLAVAGSPMVDVLRSELDKRLAPITSFINQRTAADLSAQEHQEQTLEAELIAMSKDTTKYEFFNEVMDDMADLMDMYARKGLALTPQQAYSKAIMIHPEISQIVKAREEDTQKRELAKKMNEQALKAKAGSVSVSGAPLGKPTTQISGNPGDLRGTLVAAFDQVANGSGRI